MYLIEKDRADLAAQLSNALVNDRRFTESTKLAGASLWPWAWTLVLSRNTLDAFARELSCTHASVVRWSQGM